MVSSVSPFLIATERLSSFSDRIVVRDPRARGRFPSLQRVPEGLLVSGPFSIRRRMTVTRARGVRFVEATRDPNPIHREGEVIPGAFLAAQMVSAAEILLPHLRLQKLRVTFNGIAWYDRSLRLSIRAEPSETGLELQASAWQDQREVATARLEGAWQEVMPSLELPVEEVDAAWLMRVVSFYESLGIDPERWFHKEAGPDLSYPIAFLASLPSGSMVRRFSGEGGILNRLTLEFHEARLPLAGPPEVELVPPKRLRRSFNKILTWVKEGMQTAVKGTALVLPRPPEGFVRPPELTQVPPASFPNG